MRKNINRLESICPLAGFTLEARFSSGQVVHVDMTDPVKRLAVFAPLQDRAVFARAAITDWGHSVACSEDASIDADRLMEMALEQAGRADTLEFRRWQDRDRLSLRTVTQQR